jgi:hypothetical protein
MTIEVPDDLAALFRDPRRVIEIIAMVKALRELTVQIAPAQSATALTAGKISIMGDPPRLLLPLPFQGAAIANPSVTTASNNAAIISILTRMRAGTPCIVQ